MFARRNKHSISDKLRDSVWPRRGFRRAATYIGYRVARLPGTPHSIAGGFAFGAAISFTPMVGLHLAGSALMSWALRCSILAAAIGTIVGNPWTFPFIWAWTHRCGAWMLGVNGSDHPPLESLTRLFEKLWVLIGDRVQWLFGLKHKSELDVISAGSELAELLQNVLWPMLVGSVPNAVIAWFVFYFPMRYLIAGYQQTRHQRRLRRAKMAGVGGGDVPNI